MGGGRRPRPRGRTAGSDSRGAGRILREDPYDVRPSTGCTRHAVSATRMGGPAHYPVRDDAELQRAGAPLGDVRATRAVGAANGRNPIPIIVPCHRVVGANGALTGFGGGLDRKRWLLEHEGALMMLGA